MSCYFLTSGVQGAESPSRFCMRNRLWSGQFDATGDGSHEVG